jgi:hypothetical protein
MRTKPLLLLLASCFLAGCASLQLPKSLPFGKKDPWKGKYEDPARLIAIWSDSVYNEPGKPPVRGLSARVYFYNQDSKAVPVQGQLVVYGYNDSSDGSPAKAPERKFVFTAEQLTQHFTPGELGASYSIWVPWEPVGGPKKTVTLLPVFTSSSGRVTMGQQTVNVLPGKTPEAGPEQARARRPQGFTQEVSAVQPASYQESSPAWGCGQNAGDLAGSETAQRRLRATSFPLPMTMQRMILNSGPAPQPPLDPPTSGTRPTDNTAVPGISAAPWAGQGTRSGLATWPDSNRQSPGLQPEPFVGRAAGFPGISEPSTGPPSAVPPSTRF